MGLLERFRSSGRAVAGGRVDTSERSALCLIEEGNVLEQQGRMEEAAAKDIYALVYAAERPELFFKATPHRVVGPEQFVAIRDDAKLSVPEPEFTLFVNAGGKIAGYTIGNDMSSRDIEGENPLYLPQAKVYDRSCALGPCILVSDEEPSQSTEIRLTILRGGSQVFGESTTLESLKRRPAELVQPGIDVL